MENGEREVAYLEIHGRLEWKQPRPPGSDVVVLSNIHKGSETSPAAEALSLRYVARGCEDYRIGGRGYRLPEGHVMIAPHKFGADAEARSVDRLGTLGLCILINADPDELAWAQVPLIVRADCASVGEILQKNLVTLWNASKGKTDIARRVIGQLRAELPGLAQTILSQSAAVAGAKPGTRFEMVRRAYVAQAYLHSTVERAVDLDELSTAVGASPFRLLAAFQQCFGETPASYHRKLRLKLAMDEARRRRVPISSVADEFGFAGVSSFSHAYRRTFGQPPVWKKVA